MCDSEKCFDINARANAQRQNTDRSHPPRQTDGQTDGTEQTEYMAKANNSMCPIVGLSHRAQTYTDCKSTFRMLNAMKVDGDIGGGEKNLRHIE